MILFSQVLGVDTFEKMSQGVRPTLHNVPIGFLTMNQAFLEVTQEEWLYQNGNDKENTKIEDCLPWEEVLELASQCKNRCLPVNAQYAWRQNVNRPKCHNGSDHICMMKTFMNPVKR